MDYLASMYIDNELNLEDKIRFVERIHIAPPFYEDTHALMLQEKLLRAMPDTSMIPHRPPITAVATDWFKNMLKPIIYAVSGFALAGVLLFNWVAAPVTPLKINRFVIYEPEAHQVELTGSFTGWQRIPMAPIGNNGYWELRLQLPFGEHRFTYILDGSNQIADPTLPVREKDDFGGENSILNIGEQV